jgi:CO/xanthine dehydrogenase FAD-binding subunit
VRTAVSTLDLRRAQSVEHALELVRDERRTPLAGATDLYVALNFGTLGASRFVDLWPLEELRGIEARDRGLRIGALTTFTAIARSKLVAERLPILADAARQIGGVQIQNRATLGGNIANASPAGDSLPVLAVADAMVVLRSLSGERRVPFTGFYTGYRASVMLPEELIVAIEIPAVEGRQWYRKVGTRAAQAISKVVMAGISGPRARIALGSVAPTVIRLPRTEAALAAGAGGIEAAVRQLEQEVRPIDDLRSTADYRRRVSANLLRRFWADTSSA